jgi:hypothetical protein
LLRVDLLRRPQLWLLGCAQLWLFSPELWLRIELRLQLVLRFLRLRLWPSLPFVWLAAQVLQSLRLRIELLRLLKLRLRIELRLLGCPELRLLRPKLRLLQLRMQLLRLRFVRLRLWPQVPFVWLAAQGLLQ